jgi:hypothetical protein
MTKTAFPLIGQVTAKFDQPRPLVGEKTHVHGAIDIAAPTGTPIYAPEDGWLKGAVIWRPPNVADWNMRGFDFPWKNYWQDIFGGILILKGGSGKIHLFCHLYPEQIIDRGEIPKMEWDYVEQKDDGRWPVHSMIALHGHGVRKGQYIGPVGNAGYSTGSHVHWEIHNAWEVTAYDKRPNPIDWVK